jgi:hypothetical protein
MGAGGHARSLRFFSLHLTLVERLSWAASAVWQSRALLLPRENGKKAVDGLVRSASNARLDQLSYRALVLPSGPAGERREPSAFRPSPTLEPSPTSHQLSPSIRFTDLCSTRNSHHAPGRCS